MGADDIIRGMISVGVAYGILFSCAILYRNGKLSKHLATVLGATGGTAVSVIALSPDFDPVGPSLAAIFISAAAASLAMRYVVVMLDRVFRRPNFS